MQKLTLSLLCAGLITTTSIAEDICNGAYQAQNYTQATECYLKQLKKERTFDNLRRAGQSYYKQGRHKEALTYFKEAEKKAITPDDYVLLYSYLSGSYDFLGNSTQALTYNMKVLDLNLKSGDRENIGNSYSNLGVYYGNQNQLQKALEHYEKALGYQEKLERSTTYHNMANLYDVLNNSQKAEEMYHKSIEINEQIGDYHSLSNVKCDLGIFYFKNKHYNEARATLEEALIMSQKTKQIDREAHILSTLAVMDYREKKMVQAKERASKALHLAKQSGSQDAILSDAQSAWNLVNGK